MTEVGEARVESSFGGLVDALDRIIGGGAVVAGDIVIGLDDIDLIKVDLRLLLAGIEGVPASGEESS